MNSISSAELDARFVAEERALDARVRTLRRYAGGTSESGWLASTGPDVRLAKRDAERTPRDRWSHLAGARRCR